MNKKANICSVNCPYFPNINVSEYDWTYDEKKHYKVLKEKTELRCQYDNHIIVWNTECVRNVQE